MIWSHRRSSMNVLPQLNDRKNPPEDQCSLWLAWLGGRMGHSSGAASVCGLEASNAGCVRLLPCNLQNVAKAVIVKPAHRGEVGGKAFAVSLLQLLDQGLHVGRDYFFRGLLLLRLLGSGWTGDGAVVAAVSWVLPPWVLPLPLPLNWQRHVTYMPNASWRRRGVATARGGVSPTLETERSGKGREGRAAQAQRGSLGKPLAGARGGAPERTGHFVYEIDRGHGLHHDGDRAALPALALRMKMRLCLGKRLEPWTNASSFYRAIRRKRYP
jgi:hypothetical protein